MVNMCTICINCKQVLLFIAFHYPELNMSHHLRSTWVRTGENTPLLVF